MSIEAQAGEVDKVKRSKAESSSILFTYRTRHRVKDALEIMARYHISGVPITEGGRLVGILTNRDLVFEENEEQPIGNVMTKRISSQLLWGQPSRRQRQSCTSIGSEIAPRGSKFHAQGHHHYQRH